MNFFLVSSFVLLIVPLSAAGPPAHAEGRGRPTALPATANVADAVGSNPRGRFVVEGLALRDDDDGSNPFDISFRATTSYSEGAVHIDEDGKSTPISTDSVVLIPDVAETNFFGAILVNTRTGRSKGFLVDKAGTVGPRGKSYRVTQERAGGQKSAMGLEKGNGSFAPPEDWACDVVGRGHDDARDLTTNDVHRHRHHHHHDHQEDEEVEDATGDVLGSVLDGMGESFGLRGGDVRRRQLLVGGQDPYFTDTFPNMYSYEVSIYMEYDNALETNAGGTTQDVVDYINLLNAAVSSVYEYEVDTRIKISFLEKTTRYDSASGTSRALDTMRAAWSGSNFGGGNSKIDLHHALLGNGLGGGIAYLGVVCNSGYGLGLSANMDANFATIDDPAGLVWDINVYAHEVGHNFAADHTHTWSAGGGDVDTCGDGQCPSELPSIGKATIMSYCHQCGGESNMGPTFGGHRTDATTWLDESTLGSFNVNPHRVPQAMYNHVASRGTCVAPEGAIPKQTCGNGVMDDGEDCEIGIAFTETCADLAVKYPFLTGDGTLACTGCAWDTSNCIGCGNGSLDSGEVCDTNDFGGMTCPEGGSLSCSSDCSTIDTSGCMEVVMGETNLSAKRNADVTRAIPINKATHSIKIAISGGSGDADLYVKYGAAPTTSSYDCRPYLGGNEEECSYNNAAAGNAQGMYYVLIKAYRNFSGLTLKVTADDATPTTLCTVAKDCDDGLYCNGAETCNAGTCQDGTPPDCDDGVACTIDSCDESADTCVHTPDDAQCNNLNFCDGAETCDVALDCQPAVVSASCPHGCDTVADQCFECTDVGDCDNGAWCDGTETCNAGYCQAGTDQCSSGEACDEATDTCTSCTGLVAGTPCDHKGSCVESSGDCCTECCSGVFAGSGNSKACV